LKLSLRAKINITFMILGIAVSLLLGAFSVIFITRDENQKVRQNLMTIAKIAAHSIDGDSCAQVKPGDESTAYYRGVVAKLRLLRKDSGV
jgi:hypothetical protein